MLSLFAGIGGLDLGLERAGMTVVGQVEINPFSRQVLAKHWPEVPQHDDVRTVLDWWRCEPRPRVDVVAGGYPCQPESLAGQRRGTDDDRWLWPEMARIIHALQPQWVIGENVDGHRTRGLRFVLRDLERLRYAARAGYIRACEVGAPHARSRLFVVAHTHRLDGQTRLGAGQGQSVSARNGSQGAWPDPTDWIVAASTGDRRVADGVPDGLDGRRITALGNAVVPAVGEYIGRLVVAASQAQPGTAHRAPAI